MTDKREYVCTLSKELQEKAEKELNENPTRRTKDIQALRDMVVQYPGLQIRTDDSFLLRFLRARKFDIERSFQLILNHYKMKAEHEDVFKNLRPSSIKHVLDEGVEGVLRHRDKLGRKVIVVRPGKWDPSRYEIDDMFRSHFITLSKLTQDEETQINGIILLLDMQDLGIHHALHFTPSLARRFASLLQDAIPARIKGMHYLNQSPVLDYIFAIFKFFLKDKIVRRTHFHGEKMEELAELIDEEYLPEEYGGKQPPYSNKKLHLHLKRSSICDNVFLLPLGACHCWWVDGITIHKGILNEEGSMLYYAMEDWAEFILECDEEFDEEAKYGLVKLGSQQISKEDAFEGTIGSFKKLNV